MKQMKKSDGQQRVR